MTDALLLAVVLLRGMPAATSLELRWAARLAPEQRTRIVWTTSAAGYARARGEGAAAFAPDEYEAVALAAELGRAGPEDFARWCAFKLRAQHLGAHAAAPGGFLVDARVAMGGAEGLVPYHEVYREQRVRGGGGRGGAGGARWEQVLVRRVPRTDHADGTPVQRASTWTFAQLVAHLGLELVDVVVHERITQRPRDAIARGTDAHDGEARIAEPEATWANV